MEVRFTRLTDARHAVTVVRGDGSTERVELDTRSFLRHDLAHWAVEVELGLAHGVWGSVASGGSLAGEGLDGPDMALAETLAGPVQTLLRVDADVDAIRTTLARVAPDLVLDDLPARLHARLHQLRGQWAATPFGGEMALTWPF